MRRKAERIHLDAPVGAGRLVHKAMLDCALLFATEAMDRPSGRAGLIIYVAGRWKVAVWWTKTRAINARAWEK